MRGVVTLVFHLHHLSLQIRPHNAMIDTNVQDGQNTVSGWDALLCAVLTCVMIQFPQE